MMLPTIRSTVFALALLSLGACPAKTTGGTPPPNPPASRASTPPGERWAGLFLPYPGARKLCFQHISGMTAGGPMHITWVAFASTETPERVSSFYAKNAGGAAVESGAGGLTRLRGPKDVVLSVHDAAAGGYPTCDVKPAASDGTVIIISQAAR